MSLLLGLVATASGFAIPYLRAGVVVLLLGASFSSVAENHHPEAAWSSDAIKIKKVSPTLYLVMSYKEIKLYQDKPAMTFDSNSFIYVDKHNAYLIDTPWSESDMPDLMSWLKIQKLQLKGTIVTHYHQDRAGGLGYLDKHGFATYASDMTNQLLVKDKQPPINIFSFGSQTTRLSIL